MKINYLLVFLWCIMANAQVGIGTTSPNAQLDITSSTNGVLIPRVALTSKAVSAPVVNPNGGGAPADATLVYNTASAGSGINAVAPGYYYYSTTSSRWIQLLASNIYTADGTLEGNRTVTQGANTLAFTSSAVNAFSVDGSTFSVDASNDRVGFGTTSPQRTLDIYGTDTTLGVIASGESQSASIGLGTNWNGLINGAVKTRIIAEGIGNWSRAKLHFAVSNNGWDNSSAASATVADARMTIEPGGNVGIGITSPSAQLHTTGTVRLQTLTGAGNRMVITDSNGNLSSQVITVGTVTSVSGTTPISVATGTTTPVVSLDDLGVTTAKLADNAVTNVKIADDAVNTAELVNDAVNSAKIIDNTIVNADLTAGTGGIYKGSGTLPSDVVVSMPDTASINFNATGVGKPNHFRVDASTLSVDTQNRRVGIGTTLPLYKLHVIGDSNIKGELRFESLSTGEYVGFIIGGTEGGDNTSFIIQSARGGSNAGIVFNTNNGSSIIQAARITNTGRFGLGLSSPDYKFDVLGDANIRGRLRIASADGNDAGFIVASDEAAGANKLIIQNNRGGGGILFNTNSGEAARFTASGRLGIGIDTPTSTLHNNGTTAFTVSTSGNATTVAFRTGGETFNPPAANTCPGRIYIIRHTGTSGTVTVNNVITYNSATSGNLTLIASTGTMAIVSNGTDWYRIN